MIKRILSVLLSVAVMYSCSAFCFAQDSSSAKLYEVYGDNMLFQQKKEAVLAGKSRVGAEIECAVLDSTGKEIASGKNKAGSDGSFTVSFYAPEGGFNEYTIIVKEDGKEFQRINNVLFGELWLSSGQSNMMYLLAESFEGQKMYNSMTTGSKYLRFLQMPWIPEYNGSADKSPLNPLDDIKDCSWERGDTPAVYLLSAVSYYFADKLMKDMNVPVGILNASLGGSSIKSWLSREAIDSDSQVKKDFEDAKEYIKASRWKEKGYSAMGDMTVCYNKKIAPLKNFKIAGMIWYQGEADVGWSEERYCRAFELLQKSYSSLFKFDGDMPLIYSTLAAYCNGDGGLIQLRNVSFKEMYYKKINSRYTMPIYDVSLDYLESAGAIHPSHKKEIGERFAMGAEGMVYGKKTIYYAADAKDYYIDGNSIYVNFSGVCDGLIADGDLKGFSICGEDGIYVAAKAEIKDKDTVRIWNDDIEKPVSAAYAVSTINNRSNLFSSKNGEKFLPVFQFVLDKNYNKHYAFDSVWMDCDDEKAWMHGENPGFIDTWTGDKAKTEITPDSAFDGHSGLSIKGENKSFSASPLYLYKNSKNKTVNYKSIESNWSDFGSISFMVRNNGEKDVKIKNMKIYTNSVTWYSPEASSSGELSYNIPADGEWHKVTFNLNRLHMFGTASSLTYSKSALKNIREMKLNFTGENADLSADEFGFIPDGKKTPKINRDFFSVLFGKIVKIFTKA